MNKDSTAIPLKTILNMKLKGNQILLLISLIGTLFFLSCKDEFTTDSSYRLSYSTDSLKFDTIFTEELTPLSVIKIYNETDKDIQIESCDLLTPNNCFQINLDGKSGTHFENINIFSGDSLYLFVQFFSNEVGVNAPLLIEGSIIFSYNKNKERIVLTAYGQDVHRIKSDTIKGNVEWTNDKPYIIYDTLRVDSTATLTIQEGVTLYFHPRATMQVDGRLICNGTFDAPIIFRGERKEKSYENVNNQWGGIHFSGNSTNNQLLFTEIKNGYYGIKIDSAEIDEKVPRLIIGNSLIQHVKRSVLDAHCANVYAYNSLFLRGEIRSNVVLQGGIYTFNHCTFAKTSSGKGEYGITPYTVLLADKSIDSTQGSIPLNAQFNNCIIFSLNKETSLKFECENPSEQFQYKFNHCLFPANNIEEEFYSDEFFIESVWEENPQFVSLKKDPGYDFHLEENSAARQKGDLEILKSYPECLTDKDNITRQNDTLPDLGAYQWHEEVEEESDNP